MNRFVELLSGAGDFESARAALSAGCDAIYLGLKNYGARRMADNFTAADLDKIVKLASARGKKVYLTLNTLIKDRETADFIECAGRALDSGVSALIMQDCGMIEQTASAFKGACIHASTQMNIHNSAALEFLKKSGVSRVILSRECALNEIEKICASKILSIETFVHGALCSAVSGVCYMSSFNNNRSGNRGVCTQMCRLKYGYPDAPDKFYLSTKDFCALSLLEKLYHAGVDSFKIEGRNRSAAYVYNTTLVFREALDLIYESKFERSAVERLTRRAAMTYNRGLSAAYLKGRGESDVIFCERNTGSGLLVSSKITGFDPAGCSIKAFFNDTVDKNDLLEFENDRYQRILIKIESMKTISGVNVFDTPIDKAVMVKFKRLKKESEAEDISKFLPHKIYLVHSQQASSIKKNVNREIGLEKNRENFDPSKQVIKVSVKFSARSIECDIYCLEEHFSYKCEDIIVYKAENRPLSIESVKNTFMAYNHDRFRPDEDGLNCSIEDGIFIPLSLLKKYGKNIFENFEKDFNEFKKKKNDDLKAFYSMPVLFSMASSPDFPDTLNLSDSRISSLDSFETTHKLKRPSFRMMLFDDSNVDLNSISENYEEISMHYYFFKSLYETSAAEVFLHENSGALSSLLVELPPVIFENDTASFVEISGALMKSGVKGFIINNHAARVLIERNPLYSAGCFKLSCGAALNTMNRFTAQLYDSIINFDDICLSYELNDRDIVEFLETLKAVKPVLLDKIRVRLYGNINTANFAYDFFKQNAKYINAKDPSGGRRSCRTGELAFKNAKHYLIAAAEDATLAYSGGLLNMISYVRKYMEYGVNKFDISLYNYSDYFKEDIIETAAGVENIRSGRYDGVSCINRGVAKNMILL